MLTSNRNPRSWNWRGKKPWFRKSGRFGKSIKKASVNEEREDSDSCQSQSSIQSLAAGPYRGWHLYFTESYSEKHPAVEYLMMFVEFFKRHINLYKVDDIIEQRFFIVDFYKLISESDVLKERPDLEALLISNPEFYLKAMGLSMHQVITLKQEEEDDFYDTITCEDMEDGGVVKNAYSKEKVYEVKKIEARIINVNCRLQLTELKAIYIGKLVNILGTVLRVSDVKTMVAKMSFECEVCGKIQISVFPEGKWITPTRCIIKECRGKIFTPVNKCELIETVDWQTIKIQEIDDNVCDIGRVPRTIECELFNDLVDSCTPGEIVNITGIIKVSNNDDNSFRNNPDKCKFLLYIEANFVYNSTGKEGSPVTPVAAGCEFNPGNNIFMEFTIKELYAIREIQEQDNLFRLIVHSLCPTIYGYEMVKAGLVLSLFRGTKKATKEDEAPNRTSSHVLIVGDPGLGKSQLLKACASVSPRGVYVCGSTASTTGLTVTLNKDNNGDGSLEAGALAFSDLGCCCVDEFDKMGQHQHALLEVMEQQTVSVAKSGVMCTLPSRGSILAAANPVEGHYNKSKTVTENIKIPGSLLSRFDLVFILMDNPNEERDNMLTEHLMAFHGGSRPKQIIHTGTKISISSPTELSGDHILKERLRLKPGEAVDPIPYQLLKKYIGYARQYIQPKLSQSAANVLQEFYFELRKTHRNSESVEISSRHLESLIRLAEARAKLELREEVTADDAKDAIEIMKFSLIDMYSDGYGFVDFDHSQNRSGTGTRTLAKRLVSLLTAEAKRTNNTIFSVQQIRDLVKESGLPILDLNSLLDYINTSEQSFLLQKGPRIYQLQVD